MSREDVVSWLRRNDGRLQDIFGLWTQGKRDDSWVAERLVEEGHVAALVPDGERAYTLLISATPALFRAWGDAPNDTARRLNAHLHDETVEWCRAYQAATGRADQGLRRTDEIDPSSLSAVPGTEPEPENEVAEAAADVLPEVNRGALPGVVEERWARLRASLDALGLPR